MSKINLSPFSTGDKFDWVGFMTSGVTGGMSVGQRLLPNVQTNIGGAYIASQINGQNSVDAMMGAMAGSMLGYGIGASITGQMEKSFVNRVIGLSTSSTNALKYTEIPFYPGTYLLRETPMSAVPGIAGGAVGGMGSEQKGDRFIFLL